MMGTNDLNMPNSCRKLALSIYFLLFALPAMAKTVTQVPVELIVATADSLALDFLDLPGISGVGVGFCQPSDPTEDDNIGIVLFWDDKQLMELFKDKSLLIKVSKNLNAKIILCSLFSGIIGPQPGFTVVNPGKGGTSDVGSEELGITEEQWIEKYDALFPGEMNFEWDQLFKVSSLDLEIIYTTMMKDQK